MAMQYRSWLTVPGEDAVLLGEALSIGSDVVVIDIARHASAAGTDDARANAGQWLAAHRKQILEHRAIGRWVRISPPGTRQWRDDLAAVMPAAPDGIVMPLSAGPDDVRHLAADLYELEQQHHLPAGSTRIVAVAGATAHAAMTVPAYLESPHARLAGLTWSPADLMRNIGGRRLRIGRTARWAEALAFVRAQILLTAHACGLVAIDAPAEDLVEDKAVVAALRDSSGDGFTGMFVGDIDRVGAINDVFARRDEEVARARTIVSAFEGDPENGEIEVDRRLVGRSQLQSARRTLGLDGPPVAAPVRPAILRPA